MKTLEDVGGDSAERLAFIRAACERPGRVAFTASLTAPARPELRSVPPAPTTVMTTARPVSGVAVTPTPSAPTTVITPVVASAPVRPVIDMQTAIHEGSHAVVGTVLGGRVTVAEAWPAGRGEGGRDGQCRFASLGILGEEHQHLILAAGAVGAAVFAHGPQPTDRQIDALLAPGRGARGSDFEQLRMMALTASADVPPARAVLPLVLRVWPAISRLAVQIEQRGSVGHDDVCRALGLSEDRALHSFELANIRAGMRAVPQARASERLL